MPQSGDGKLLFSGAFAISLIYVNYAYTGWNAATYIAGEMDHPQRNLPFVLIGGTLIVMVLYLLLNISFLYGAPMEAMMGRIEIGFVVAGHAFGEQAAEAKRTGRNDIFWAAHYMGVDWEYCHMERLANLGATSGAAVLALSQHNRDRRQRAADSPPRPTDIRGSAALVEKVWGLVQIHRPGVDPGNDVDPEQAALHVTANRYGGTGHVPVRFVGQRQRFELPRLGVATWG